MFISLSALLLLSLSLSYKIPFNYLFRSKTCSPRSRLYYYSLSLSHVKYRSITCLDQRHVHLALGSIITISLFLSYKIPFNYLFRSKTCSPRSRLYYYSLSLSHIKYRSITCLDQRHVHLALGSIITLSLSHIKYRSITCLDQRHVHLTVHSIITLSLSYKIPFNYLFRSKTCSPRSRLYYYSLSLI